MVKIEHINAIEEVAGDQSDYLASVAKYCNKVSARLTTLVGEN
jgi:hypothetical protein